MARQPLSPPTRHPLTRWTGRTVIGLAVLVALALGAAAPSGAATEAEDTAYVRAVHVDIVDAEPSPESLASWVADLQSGAATRRDLARDRALGLENLTQEVTQLYLDALGRAPDENGLNHWVNTLGYTSYGFSRATVDIWGSWEAVQSAQAAPDPYVRWLYEAMLGRTASDAEAEYWSTVASQKGARFVARQLYESLEHRQTRVTEIFTALLGRSPDAAALTYWSGEIRRLGDLWATVSILSSAEYGARAVTRFP